MKLFHRDLGEANAQKGTVIILHGLFGTSDNWYTLAKQLAESYQVILVDLRNHGQSPHAPEFNYSVMAADVKELIEDLGIRKPHLVGHSMGGKTAMQLAVTQPQLLKSLTVVDIAPRHYPPHHQIILKAFHSLPLHEIKSRGQADKLMAEVISDMGVRQFLLKNLDRTSEGSYQWKMNLPVIEQNIEAVGEALSSDARYEGPTLFIDGENSDYITEADEALISQHFPNAQVRGISGAGHWVHAEKPKETLEVMLQFLQEAGG